VSTTSPRHDFGAVLQTANYILTLIPPGFGWFAPSAFAEASSFAKVTADKSADKLVLLSNLTTPAGRH